ATATTAAQPEWVLKPRPTAFFGAGRFLPDFSPWVILPPASGEAVIAIAVQWRRSYPEVWTFVVPNIRPFHGPRARLLFPDAFPRLFHCRLSACSWRRSRAGVVGSHWPGKAGPFHTAGGVAAGSVQILLAPVVCWRYRLESEYWCAE